MIKSTHIYVTFVMIATWLVGFTSCEKNVNVNFDDFEPSLIVQSVFSPDSSWYIDVSKTKSIFDSNTDLGIDDASITITNLTGNYILSVENLGNGKYYVPNKSIPGHYYRIVVSAPTFENVIVTSSDRVPEAPDFEVFIDEKNSSSGLPYYEIAYKLEENPDNENFYVVEFYDLSDNPEGPNNEEAEEGVIGDIRFNTRDSISGFNIKGFIANSDFSNGTYEGKYNDPSLLVSNSSNRIGMTIQSVSKDLFEYLRSSAIIEQSNVSNSNLSTPPQPHTNIENGLGIFGAYNETMYLITP